MTTITSSSLSSSDSDAAERCQSPLQIVHFSGGFWWCRHVSCRSRSISAETRISLGRGENEKVNRHINGGKTKI